MKEFCRFTIDKESFSDYIHSMKYQVSIKKSCFKAISKLSKKDKETLSHLISDLGESGPVQPGYRNYSKLGNFTYHCHLSYHWVACWQCRNGEFLVEVYYVGSRESAPY